MGTADGFPPAPGANFSSRSLSSTLAVVKPSPASPYSFSPPLSLSLEAREAAAAEVFSPAIYPPLSLGCCSLTAPPSSSWWPCSGPPLRQPSSGALSTSSFFSPRSRFSKCSQDSQRQHVGPPQSQVTWPCTSTQASPPFSPLHGFELGREDAIP